MYKLGWRLNRHSSSWQILLVIGVVPQGHPRRGPPGYIIFRLPLWFSRAPRSLIIDGDVLHPTGLHCTAAENLTFDLV
jgi:hypothetical protein